MHLESFNPRTRVGCDKVSYSNGVLHSVSIHAPVWGATRDHKPPVCLCGFNPRTRVGCDVISLLFGYLLIVSIHAPVWGATEQVEV